MSRRFNEQERSKIRAELLTHGQAFLSTYGVRKTNVEDLTMAVGISKGAFYAFFSSKEELFLCLFEQFEAEYRTKLLAIASQQPDSPRERIRSFLFQSITLWRTSPLFRHFDREAFEYLARRLPAERMQSHQHDDEAFVGQLLEHWRTDGLVLTCTAKELNGLFRALFFVSLHADDIGADVYPTTIGLLADLIANHLVDHARIETPEQKSEVRSQEQRNTL